MIGDQLNYELSLPLSVCVYVCWYAYTCVCVCVCFGCYDQIHGIQKHVVM
jgi:hypothetical protein